MRLVRLSAAIAVAAAVLLVPVAASADSTLRTDPVGDVQSFRLEDQSEIPTPTAEPLRTIGDIYKGRITHSTTSVRVEVYYRALPKSGLFNLHQFRFKTSKLTRDLSIGAGAGGWAGEATMYYASGTEYPCRGLRFLIDYPNKRVIANVPRACLGNPSFVKVGFGFASYTQDKVYLDDGQIADSNGDDLVLSPGVYKT